MDNPTTAALTFVRRFLTQYYPDVEAALLAGSRSRSEGRDGSDYDVILLLRSLPDGAWREMRSFEGQFIEVFAHDLGTLAYFLSGGRSPVWPSVLPTMIAEGVPVVQHPSALLGRARQIAANILESAPPALTGEALRTRRYEITELAATLAPDRDRAVVIAVGATLHSKLADFALRAAGRWSATGKAIPRAPAKMDAVLATQYTTAFRTRFETGEVAPVQSLAGC